MAGDVVGGVRIKYFDWSSFGSCAYAWTNHCGQKQWRTMIGPLGACAHLLAREGGTVAGSPHQNHLIGAGGGEQIFRVVDLDSQTVNAH